MYRRCFSVSPNPLSLRAGFFPCKDADRGLQLSAVVTRLWRNEIWMYTTPSANLRPSSGGTSYNDTVSPVTDP